MKRLLAVLFAVAVALPVAADTQVVCSITPQAETACSAITVSQAGQLDQCRCNQNAPAPAGPFGGHATLADGLVSYWPLDEESGVRADLVGSNDLTDNNTVTSVDSNHPGFGKAAKFTAADLDYLSRTGDFATSAQSTGFTVAFWSKTLSAGYPLCARDDVGSNRSWSYTGLVIYGFSDDATYQAANLTGWIDNTWQLHIVWYDPADKKMRGQIDDGAVAASAALAGAGLQDQTGANFTLGRHSTSYTTTLCAQVGYWARPLTAQERTDLYNSGAGLFYED